MIITVKNGVKVRPAAERAPDMILEFSLPELPPSDNELYWSPRGTKKRILTDVGESFKNGIKESLSAVYEATGWPSLDKSMMLRIQVLCRIPHLFTTGEKAKNWFRILDAHNRGKVLIDAISEHFGIQDAQSFSTLLEKCEGGPAVHVRISRMDKQPVWPEGF
jgi:hypothetical protein